MKIHLLLLFILALVLVSCVTEEPASSSLPVLKKEKISGYVQKGPFISGASLKMTELNTDFVQTSKSFSSIIMDDMGLFELNDIELNYSIVEFTSSGLYFNEVSGEVTLLPITLTALSDINTKSAVNINVLTHLERGRVKTLLKEDKKFSEAKTQSRNELLSIFSLSIQNNLSCEDFDLSQSNESGAILLAISIILQGKRSVGQLRELITKLEADFSSNGKLDDEDILNSLRASTLTLDFKQIRENIEKRFKELKIDTPVADFEKQLIKFLSFKDYPLTITIEGEGVVEEKVISSPSGKEYPYSTVVELTPKPNEGWAFDSWGGDLSGNAIPSKIAVDGDKKVTAKFIKKDYPLNLTIEGEGTVAEKIVTSPSGKMYPYGTTVELTPVAKEGWSFDSWSGDLNGSDSPKTITVDKEKNVTAKFKRKDYRLTITIEGEGTVIEKIVTSPNSRLYPFETVVELTSVAKEGWIFDGWGGDLSGFESPETIILDGEKKVTAIFSELRGISSDLICDTQSTMVVDVTNPKTGKTWMDRNLGASRVAISFNDVDSYGHLFQWDREDDGHQCRTSGEVNGLSVMDQPSNNYFILSPNLPYDWREAPKSNAWYESNEMSNPCPEGYRLPTEAELSEERLSWNDSSRDGAFASPLKLPAAGARFAGDGSINDAGLVGYYWTSTVKNSYSSSLIFGRFNTTMFPDYRANGLSVRCIKK